MSLVHRIQLFLAAVCLAALTASPSAAQFPNSWLPTGSGDYTSGNNWSEGGVPSIEFQEVAVVNNGGTAQLQNATPPDVGGITLGQTSGGSGDFSGTLEIGTGGNLTAVNGVNNNGALVVGSDAPGTLSVSGDGQLTAASIQSNGTSTINLSDTASLSSPGAATLNGVTNVIGQGASLASDQSIVLGAGSTLQVDIDGSAAPLMTAGNAVSLGGTLEVDFGGSAPTPGSSWNLFDTSAIAGQFSQIDVADGPLETGQRLRVQETADGSSMNGLFGQLLLEQLLVLEVNRDTGAVQILNPSGASSSSLDSYAITSGNESFNVADGTWSSLADQAEPGWIEANPQATQLAELNTDGSTGIGGGNSLSLGTPWNPQYTELGQDFEDIAFRYSDENGQVVDAPVVYTGSQVNDVTLFVDPDTGEAQLRNASAFPVGIEGYTVRSSSMSLTPADWDSLQEHASDWLEANPTSGALSELKTDGVEMLFASGAYNLGQLFDTSGTQDLMLEYLLPGESQPSQGRVLYQELPPMVEGVIGDYNGDNVVNAADYVVWRNNLDSAVALPNEDPSVTPGQVTQEDYEVWRNNFGNTASAAGSGTSAAVPEPSGVVMMLCTALLACGGRAAQFRQRGALH